MEDKQTSSWSTIFGIVLTLIELGLPMIGVTVNLLLGAAILVVAFSLLVYGFCKWERSSRWHYSLRILTVIVGALIYFFLVGIQIRTQYRKDHPAVAMAALPSRHGVTPLPLPVRNASPSARPKPRHGVLRTNPASGARGSVYGSRNTLVFPVGNAPTVMGNDNTIVGATDANGNTILNGGGTAIGAGATANPTSIAIGAGAHAGGQIKNQQRCENGSLCNQDSQVNAPQTVNNYNYGPPALKLAWTAEAKQSEDAVHPYYEQITITPNVEWHPVSIVVKCSSQIQAISPYGVLFHSDAFVTAQNDKWGYVYVGDPGVAAGEHMIVGIFADRPFTVLSVQSAPISARKNVLDR